MIRQPGRFKDQTIYAPYFWNAYLDGTYDDEYVENGEHVVVFNVTEDDRYDYPELGGATTVYIWEDTQGVLRTRLDRQCALATRSRLAKSRSVSDLPHTINGYSVSKRSAGDTSSASARRGRYVTPKLCRPCSISEM